MAVFGEAFGGAAGAATDLFGGDGGGLGEEGFDFGGGELFAGARGETTEREASDLIAFEAFHGEAESEEELANLAFFAVVHVHV